MSNTPPRTAEHGHEQWLVRFAVTNLLDYILDTEDLSVIRGSSVELEEFVANQAKLIEHPDAGVEIIYARASEMLISTRSEESAKRIAQQLEVEFKQGDSRFATAGSAIAKLPVGQSLKPIIRELEGKLRRQQMSRPSVLPPPSLEGSQACQIEGVRPADAGSMRYKDDQLRKVSQHVKRRYDTGRERRSGLVGKIFEKEFANVDLKQWRQSFTDLEEYNRPDAIEAGKTAAVANSGSVSGKMCVLHADGNKFNRARSHLANTDEFKNFSALVEQAIEAALRACIGNLLERALHHRTLPLHLLYYAGDEFTLILPAAYAVGATLGLLKNFSNEAEGGYHRRRIPPPSNGTLTLALGAVICDTHEPIQRAHALAQELAESAKRRIAAAGEAAAYDAEKGNVLDFTIIESGFLPQANALETYRKETLGAGWSAGPDTRNRPFERSAFKKLVTDVQLLRSAFFPTGRLHEFARIALESKDPKNAATNAWPVFQRLKNEVKKDISGLVPKSVDECESNPAHFLYSWLDRKEIWDYVPAGE